MHLKIEDLLVLLSDFIQPKPLHIRETHGSSSWLLISNEEDECLYDLKKDRIHASSDKWRERIMEFINSNMLVGEFLMGKYQQDGLDWDNPWV